MERIQVNESSRIKILARTLAGALATGQTFDLAIRRDVDGWWWNGSGFQSAYTTVTMTETDVTNLAGVYHYDFTPSVTDFTATFYAENAVPATTADPYVGEIVVGYWVDDLDTALTELGSSSDLTQVKSRLGGSMVDVEFARLRGLISTVLDELKRIK